MSKISIQEIQNSRIAEADFENIKFGSLASDHMFIADYIDGEWKDSRIVPYGNMSVSPANMAWHYGQAIFEGMKASKGVDGVPYLYRPEKHAKRFNHSAKRMNMPAFPEDLYVEALHKLVGLDSAWIPPLPGCALYIRPFMIAYDNHIGVRPSHSYRFMIITMPAGAYYSKRISLKVEETYVRAVDGGVGNVKNAGNYGASLYPTTLAQKEGFDQILWLDGNEKKYIQEVGTMNIFFVIDGNIVTPEIESTILEGITRDSILTVLKDKGYNVIEKRISIDEVIKAHEDGLLTEVFGAGTAAVIAQVGKITYRGKEMALPSSEVSIEIKATIDGIRNTEIDDKFGWMVPVGSVLATSDAK